MSGPTCARSVLPGPGSSVPDLTVLYDELHALRVEVAELRADLGVSAAAWLSPADAARLIGKPRSALMSACRVAHRAVASPDFTIWVAVDAGGRARQVKGAPIAAGDGRHVVEVLARLDDSASDPRRRVRQSYVIRRRDLVSLRLSGER